jgi:ribosomal protein S18 acetylase RimI-like enzyme
MTGTIRQALPDELPLLADIERDAARLFRTVGLPEIAEAEPTPLAFLEAVARCGAIFVATEDDAPVGFILVGFLDRAAHIHEFCVMIDHGRKGIGRRLVAEACRHGAVEGMPAVTLSTFHDIPWNGPFYERLGFHYLERDEWTPALYLLHHREIELGLPVARRSFMRKDLT